MSKQSVILVFSIVFMFAALGGGAYFLLQKFSTKDTKKVAQKSETDLSLESIAARSKNTSTVNNGGLSVQDGDSLQVMGAGSGPKTTTAESQLPSPDNYEVYEEFSSAESTQYIDIVQGNGAQAAQGDTLAVVYSGWLTNGTLFDQTRKNEQGQLVAFSFTLGGGQVIKGWEQGLLGMKEGGKRRLIIPSQFGYGETGSSDIIPPNSMLIFDVELAKVQKPAP